MSTVDEMSNQPDSRHRLYVSLTTAGSSLIFAAGVMSGHSYVPERTLHTIRQAWQNVGDALDQYEKDHANPVS